MHQCIIQYLSCLITKPTKWHCVQRRLRSAWASAQSDHESWLSSWIKLGSLATHWVHNEDSDQTGWMPRPIWVFAGRIVTLLVLSCRGSSLFLDPSVILKLFKDITLAENILCKHAWEWLFVLPKSLFCLKKTKEIIAPLYDKTNKMSCAPSEDSDQPWHPPSLIRAFALCFMGS